MAPLTGLQRLVHWCATVIAVIAIGAMSGIHVYRVHATAGQIIKLVTSDGGSTFYVGRCFRTDIRVQTDSLNANSVDIMLPYNPSYVQPYTGSGCSVAATAIQTDGLFPSYPANTIAGNEIDVTAFDPGGTSPVNTGVAPADKLLGHVYWKVIAASGAYSFNFTFTTGTTDTNMAQQNGDGTDVLDAVQNLTLNLSADSTAPTFSSLSPSSGATGISVTTGISYSFADAGAGVNTGSLTTKLNGTLKSLTFSACSRTNSNRVASCTSTLNSVGTLNYNTIYQVVATGSDVASPSPNQASQAWLFTTEDDTNAPYVTNQNPSNGQTGVAVNSNIVFHVKDYKNNAGVTPGLGVDITTVQVAVTPAGGGTITYTSVSPQFSYTGTSADYTVTINPTVDFSQNTVVSVAINASDLHVAPNVMSTVNYSFTTIDTSAPAFSGFSPTQNATGVAPNVNVVFHITDAGAGVAINSTTVTVAGTAYTSASSQFTYTGTSADYTITINPTANFSGGQVVTVAITTQDLAGAPNSASTSYTFTVLNACTTCSVDTESPARFTTSATLSPTVSFHIKDSASGIKQSSIRMTLLGSGAAITSNPLVLTGSSLLVGITGTSANYTVTVTLPATISANTPYSILIEATDIDSVPMATVGYTFMDLVMNVCSSSGSSSSSSSSCPSVNGAITTTGTNTGGGNRDISSILDGLTSDQLPQIVTDRNLPMRDGILHAAAETSYADVPAGVWYEGSVGSFVQRGILDGTQGLFRGGDTAVRAEFAKILGKLNGGSVTVLPSILTFDDVPRTSWYAPFVEYAAHKNWMRGYRNCAGTHPCTAMPASTISRAEAIAMAVRFYGLTSTGKAPPFADVSSNAWYSQEMAIAADHCIAQPNGLSYLARPSELLTRAQMVVLLHRAEHSLSYGKDCSWPGMPLPESFRITTESSAAASSLASSINRDSSSSSSFISTQPSSAASSSFTSSHLPSSVSMSSSAVIHSAAPDLPAGTTIQNPAPPVQMALATTTTMLLVGILGALALGRIFLH